MNIKTRLEAAQDKEKQYFTGKKCKHGHLSARWTLTGNCVQCNSDAAKERYKKIKSILNG